MDRDIIAFVVITATIIFIILFLIGVWSSHFFEYCGRICFYKCTKPQSSTSDSTRSPNIDHVINDFPATGENTKSVFDIMKENEKRSKLNFV